MDMAMAMATISAGVIGGVSIWFAMGYMMRKAEARVVNKLMMVRITKRKFFTMKARMRSATGNVLEEQSMVAVMPDSMSSNMSVGVLTLTSNFSSARLASNLSVLLAFWASGL